MQILVNVNTKTRLSEKPKEHDSEKTSFQITHSQTHPHTHTSKLLVIAPTLVCQKICIHLPMYLFISSARYLVGPLWSIRQLVSNLKFIFSPKYFVRWNKKAHWTLRWFDPETSLITSGILSPWIKARAFYLLHFRQDVSNVRVREASLQVGLLKTLEVSYFEVSYFEIP